MILLLVVINCLVLLPTFVGLWGMVALLSFSSWCLVIDVWLFPAVPWVCLQFFNLNVYSCVYVSIFFCVPMPLTHCVRGSTVSFHTHSLYLVIFLRIFFYYI